jgi:Zn-dependent peptidase ImmA (M78 family)
MDENTVIVKVDYDTAEELKAQYNVVAQHTLVKLDKEGNAVVTDRGAATLEDVEAL